MTLRPEPYRHLETAKVFSGLTALADEARARGVDVSALALAWVLGHPRVDAAIIGPRRPSHLGSALTALSVSLSEAEHRRLSELFPPVS